MLKYLQMNFLKFMYDGINLISGCIYASLTLIYIYTLSHPLQKRVFSLCFTSWIFQDKLSPQTWWHKTTERYCLTVLDSGNTKSVCWQSHRPCGLWREKFVFPSSLSSFQWLLATLALPWLVERGLTSVLLCVMCICVSVLFFINIRKPVTRFSACPNLV